MGSKPRYSANTRGEHAEDGSVMPWSGSDSPVLRVSTQDDKRECVEHLTIPWNVNALWLITTLPEWAGTEAKDGHCPGADHAEGGSPSATFRTFFGAPLCRYPTCQLVVLVALRG